MKISNLQGSQEHATCPMRYALALSNMYHSVCSLVRLGPPHTLSSKRVRPPGTKGETHSPAGEGGGVPLRTSEEKAYRTPSTLKWHERSECHLGPGVSRAPSPLLTQVIHSPL
jgi:hypothetical protein